MKRFIALAVGTAFLIPPISHAQSSSPTDVRIVNDEREPVLSSIQDGRISVDNDQFHPIPVYLPPAAGPASVCLESCRPTFQATFPASSDSGTVSFVVGVVPPGKRWVIETVSVHGQVGSPAQYLTGWTVRTTTNGVSASYGFPIQKVASSYWQGGLSAKLYADAGTEVQMYVSRQGGTAGPLKATGSITGYEVDMP